MRTEEAQRRGTQVVLPGLSSAAKREGASSVRQKTEGHRDLTVNERNSMNIEQIARIAHETNRAYCQTIGDDSQPSWENAPDWQRSSAINGVEFHLDCHKLGIMPAPSASHDSWLKEKADAGWTFGPVKDAEKREHPCFVPYDELPVEQRMKDYLFGNIVAAFTSAQLHQGATA
jgi:hypothetical protein